MRSDFLLFVSQVNIEIKAKCNEHQSIREFLKSSNADYKGSDHQIDTYFKVSRGRLKLREGNIENCLVYYERDDESGPKQSNVILFQNQPDSSLKEILTRSLDVLVVVDKQREIYFINNVKFHLDNVKDLDCFVEIEAIDKTGNLSKNILLEQCDFYMKMLNISKNDLVSCSYSDLLLQKQ